MSSVGQAPWQAASCGSIPTASKAQWKYAISTLAAGGEGMRLSGVVRRVFPAASAGCAVLHGVRRRPRTSTRAAARVFSAALRQAHGTRRGTQTRTTKGPLHARAHKTEQVEPRRSDGQHMVRPRAGSRARGDRSLPMGGHILTRHAAGRRAVNPGEHVPWCCRDGATALGRNSAR